MEVLDIYNQALSRIGQQRVTAINSGEPDALIISGFYEGTRNQVLSMIPWNCAVKREKLNSLKDTENLTDFSYAYSLPEDCLRVLSLGGKKGKTYRIEGKVLYTDEGEGEEEIILTLRYISVLEDVNSWSENLKEAVICLLAKKACLQITDNLQLAAYLDNIFITSLQVAQQTSNEEDQEDISSLIATLGNSSLAGMILSQNNYAAG